MRRIAKVIFKRMLFLEILLAWCFLFCTATKQTVLQVHPISAQNQDLIHYSPVSYQIDTYDPRRGQVDKSSGIYYTQGSNTLQSENDENTLGHSFNSPLTKTYQTWPPYRGRHVFYGPKSYTYQYQYPNYQYHYPNIPRNEPQNNHIAAVPVHVYRYQNYLPSRRLHIPNPMFQNNFRRWNLIPRNVSVQGEVTKQNQQIYVPFRRNQGQNIHFDDTNSTPNNLIPDVQKPDFHGRKPEVDINLTHRFGGSENDGISAWGGNAEILPAASTPDTIDFRGISDKKLEEGKSMTRRIRDLLGQYGVTDYVPVGTHMHYKPRTGDRYDVWTTNDAQVDISTLQSDKRPPGYYNYPKMNGDRDDENKDSNHRAIGYRPIEHFSPPDKDIFINLLDRYPQEHYQYVLET